MPEKLERSARSFGASAADLLVAMQDRKAVEESAAVAGMLAMMDGFRDNGGFDAIARWSGRKWKRVLAAAGAVLVAVGGLIAAILDDDDEEE